MEIKEKVTRSFNFEIRAEKDEKHGAYIDGRPIVYNSKTDMGCFDEVIEPGALDNADLRDVRLLKNHDTLMIPLARSRRNNENSTMQLSPDKNGLKIRANLDVENNSEARSTYSGVQRGDISGMSFMFTINKQTWENMDTDHPTRRILEIGKVYEVSIVTFPAYEETEIYARNKAALESAKEALERAKGAALDNAGDLELEKAKNKNRII